VEVAGNLGRMCTDEFGQGSYAGGETMVAHSVSMVYHMNRQRHPPI